ncbi:MAG: biopolymer transporter ExbD [Tannerella sp.]|uniref:ExbD/TolR family protein n=1 Tax=Coprobacter fastidiosus TaxID=1099853 RepID=UPI0026186B87|nr:biopolymer transporter ExbD [Coprobacter fastidiosus]MBS6268603.1 biopolymer transporter ExbD [Tannerella sp.]
MAEVQQKDNGGGKGKQKKMTIRVDFTPMVDMNMLLITFFMLCTSLSKPQTMEISMPSNDKSITEEDQTKVKASRAITLILGGDDRVFYYTGEPNYEDYTSLKETTYEADGLRAMLMGRNADIVAKIKALKAEKLEKKFSDEEYNERAMKIKDVNTAPVVMIKATDDATYENLVDALDEMQICSISKYAIVDITEGDEFLLDNLEQKGKLTENIDRDQIKETN